MPGPCQGRTRHDGPMPRALTASLLLLPAIGLVACSSSSSTPKVKANGCTAHTTTVTNGRHVIGYTDKTTDPHLTADVAAAVAAWNAAPVHITLAPVTANPAITFVQSSTATSTTPCSGHGQRAATVSLDLPAFLGTGGKSKAAHPVRDVSIEIGHAVGITRAGNCGALMTKKSCSTYPVAPNADEMAEINKLYP